MKKIALFSVAVLLIAACISIVNPNLLGIAPAPASPPLGATPVQPIQPPIDFVLDKDPEEGFSENEVKALRYSTTVQLLIAVEGEDQLKNNIYSYMSRELRSLGDVTVVTNDGDWIIWIVVIANKLTDGTHVGFCVSIVVEEQFRLLNHAGLEALFSDWSSTIDETAYTYLSAITANLSKLARHTLTICDKDHLQHTCRSIVASFDVEQLKPEREFRQRLMKEMSDSPKKSAIERQHSLDEMATTPKPKGE